jgi:hypothetical protein
MFGTEWNLVVASGTKPHLPGVGSDLERYQEGHTADLENLSSG